MDEKLFVRGFIDMQPIYDRYGNWKTTIEIGDVLIAAFTGFGSEILNYGERYHVIEFNNEICLESEDNKIIDAWHTKDTMPFFLKLRK